jgi:hypothetical protein
MEMVSVMSASRWVLGNAYHTWMSVFEVFRLDRSGMMKAVFFHVRLLVDVFSMKMFVWILGRKCELLDSHLFFFDRYSDLADHHRQKGRLAKADRLAAIAEAYFQAAPDDDEPPEAAAIAIPVPRPMTSTNAVSTTRVRTRSGERSHLVPSQT